MSFAEKFHAAVKVIDSLPQNGPFQPSQELLLKFYAYRKQATEGSCNTEKPYFWDIASKQKWNTWKSLGDMSKEEAMEKYVEELIKIIETMSYNEAISNFMDTMGPLYETVWLDEPEAEASANAEGEMSDSSFEVIKQEQDIPVEDIPVDNSTLQNANQAAEKVKFAFQFRNPCSQHSNRSKKTQKASSKTGAEKASSSSSSTAAFSRSKSSSNQDLHTSTAAGSSSVLKHCGSKQDLRNIPVATVKELLLISVLSLQHSLEEVIKRLDRMEVLIKLNALRTVESSPKKSLAIWELPYWATLFAVIWPFVSHWLIQSRWQKR